MLEVKKGITETAYQFIQKEKFPFLTKLESEFQDFRKAYQTMPLDNHLNQGEGERTRYYARLAIQPQTEELFRFPHDVFYQSKKYDILYGDIHREFAPMPVELMKNPFFQSLVRFNLSCFPIPDEQKQELFEISVHAIRIAATPHNHLGRPAPEGIHQDGYSFVGIHLMDRHNLTGAENRIHNLDKKVIDRKTLYHPLDSFLFDDSRIFHSVEPFKQKLISEKAHRDMLILLYQPLSLSPQKLTAPIPL